MKQHLNILFGILCASILFTSCSDAFEVSPDEVLLADNYLGDDKIDARSALFGVLSQMQDITGQYIVLGEARADLVDVTSDAGDEIRQINRHDIDPDNSYINPVKLFSMINNCNYALKGIDTAAYESELLEDYVSILRVRTWAQLQILVNYGKLPYITEPVKSNEDLEKDLLVLSFNQGLDQLMENLEPFASVDNVSKYANSLTYNIQKMIPNNDILMGDLHLWRGDNVLAAIYYKQFLDDNVSGSLYNLQAYSVSYTPVGSGFGITNRWLDIFQETVQNNEVINFVGFSDQYRQPNNSYSVVTEQIKPSVLAVNKWSLEFKGYEGSPFELVDNRAEGSYEGIGELARITKYQEEYFVWNRAAKIYLRYAEAINYAGYPKQALAIVNGIFNSTTTTPVNAPIFNNSESFLNFDINDYYTLDNNDRPTGGNQGVRGRAGMAPVTVPEDISQLDSINLVGQLILNEGALELAFEGNRWEDLLRFAKRDNDPTIIADPVSEKFEISGDAATASATRAKLMNPENWYLPLALPGN
ncbi:RagB/SusD family nutrient uptake outer membrane protein [Flavicella sediminum]|uniref:RagB/SusD family nutrient uptake outer membrane protein n=1 Tax=Flavicella sediminum TaxID=2585141 RepID=UPI00112387DC|nr:RagB/SusD family nutrient uptake outer membrane protein [Flavicella sediminum]